MKFLKMFWQKLNRLITVEAMRESRTSVHYLKFRCPPDLKDYYIKQIDENRIIYGEKLKFQTVADIEDKASEVFEEILTQGDLMGAHIQSNYYKNKWFDVSYRILVSWISMTYQLWEQQLKSFVCSVIDSAGIKCAYPDDAKSCSAFIVNHSDIKGVSDFSSFSKIDEMRLIVNVIKHAEGCSADKLKKIRPDIFLLERNSIDGEDVEGDLRIANSHQSIADRSLNLSDNDYYDYSKSLIKFWNEMEDVEISIPIERQIAQSTATVTKSTDLPI